MAAVTTVAAATTAATSPNEVVTTISLVITIVCGLRTLWLWIFPHIKTVIDAIKAKRIDKVNDALRDFAKSLDTVSSEKMGKDNKK